MDAANVAIPEALLYHVHSVEEGHHVVDILECNNSFIRAVINDRLLKDGANPLHVMADVFERLLEKPGTGNWHPRVNQWA